MVTKNCHSRNSSMASQTPEWIAAMKRRTRFSMRKNHSLMKMPFLHKIKGQKGKLRIPVLLNYNILHSASLLHYSTLYHFYVTLSLHMLCFSPYFHCGCVGWWVVGPSCHEISNNIIYIKQIHVFGKIHLY